MNALPLHGHDFHPEWNYTIVRRTHREVLAGRQPTMLAAA
jgi:hypothetical protein